jgi:hypothetical protein
MHHVGYRGSCGLGHGRIVGAAGSRFIGAGAEPKSVVVTDGSAQDDRSGSAVKR